MRRAIAGTGRVFITAGVLILLFVAYQLWGTGFFERRAQAELRDDFEEQLEGQPRTSSTTVDDGPPPSTTTTTTVPPPPPIPPGGEPVAIIRIPKIGVDKVVVEGTAVADLRKGPGHYAGTPLPGQEGNAAIAGHRTTYGAPFGDLDQLVPGDLISVQTLAGTWDYAVLPEGVFAVHPGQIEVLDPTPDAATLTLTTCNPKYSASERLVVKAQLQRDEEPQPAPPETRRPPSLDAGLSGTRDSRLPTIASGVIAAALGALWWLAFHRHRGLVTWVAGALPFAAALFVFYAFLERVLPSNY